MWISPRQSASALPKGVIAMKINSYTVTLEFHCGGQSHKDALSILLFALNKSQQEIKDGEIKDMLDIFANVEISLTNRR